MCGIFGAFGWTAFPPEARQRALDQMAPRGPDDQGHWTAPGARLGHRRLAILDLDHRAAQPMPDATCLVSREPDLRGQAGFWLLGSVPEPPTGYRDIQAVPAGHCLWIEDGQVTRQRCWQDIGDAWRQADRTPVPPAPEVRAHVRQALRESGARDLQGVTITDDEFRGQHQVEAPVAVQIAAHWGIRHHVRRVTRDEFLADIPRILAYRSHLSTYLGWSAWRCCRRLITPPSLPRMRGARGEGGHRPLRHPHLRRLSLSLPLVRGLPVSVLWAGSNASSVMPRQYYPRTWWTGSSEITCQVRSN